MTTTTQDVKVQRELAKFLVQLHDVTTSMGLLKDMMSLTIYSMERLQTILADSLETMVSTGLKSEGVEHHYTEDELAKMKRDWPKSSERGVYLEPVGSHETNPFNPPIGTKGAFSPEKPTKPPTVDELAEMAAGWPKEDS